MIEIATQTATEVRTYPARPYCVCVCVCLVYTLEQCVGTGRVVRTKVCKSIRARSVILWQSKMWASIRPCTMTCCRSSSRKNTERRTSPTVTALLATCTFRDSIASLCVCVCVCARARAPRVIALISHTPFFFPIFPFFPFFPFSCVRSTPTCQVY